MLGDENNLNRDDNISGKTKMKKVLLIMTGFALLILVIFSYKQLIDLEDTNESTRVNNASLSSESNEKKNPHMDSHISREELFRYGDDLSIDAKWRDKAFVVIDTLLTYPENMDLRPNSVYLTDYDLLKTYDLSILLPNVIGDYTFESASIGYQSEFPEEEDVVLWMTEHENERFIVKEVDSGETGHVSYSYRNSAGDLYQSVHIRFNNSQSKYQSEIDAMKNHQILAMDDKDLYISKSDYIGVTYFENKTRKRFAEHHYVAAWLDSDLDIEVSVCPRNNYNKKNVEKEKDGEIVIVETFPEDTKDRVIDFSKLIHALIQD